MSIAEKFATMEYGPAPEDSKEALTWLDRHGRQFGHFINGAWAKPGRRIFRYVGSIDRAKSWQASRKGRRRMSTRPSKRRARRFRSGRR